MSQNPESLTWEKVIDPAVIATTIAASAMGLRSIPATAGAMIEPAVVAATVADPWATRNAMATRKPARITGMPAASRPSAMV